MKAYKTIKCNKKLKLIKIYTHKEKEWTNCLFKILEEYNKYFNLYYKILNQTLMLKLAI